MNGVNSDPIAITAFFPAYNDADTLPTLVSRAVETLRAVAHDYEIVVIDDGSTDQTAEVLETLRQRHPCLRFIRHPHNLGYGAALRSGFRQATKELVFYTDGDGQYDVGELKSLVPLLRPDVDAVVGYKMHRADSGLRRLLGQVYCWGVKRCFGLKVRDVDCDFRLIRRKLVDHGRLTLSSGAICVQLMHGIEAQGARIVEVPVNHYPRLHGRSQFFRLGPVMSMLKDVARLFFTTALLRMRLASAEKPFAARAHSEEPS